MSPNTPQAVIAHSWPTLKCPALRSAAARAATGWSRSARLRRRRDVTGPMMNPKGPVSRTATQKQSVKRACGVITEVEGAGAWFIAVPWAGSAVLPLR